MSYKIDKIEVEQFKSPVIFEQGIVAVSADGQPALTNEDGKLDISWLPVSYSTDTGALTGQDVGVVVHHEQLDKVGRITPAGPVFPVKKKSNMTAWWTNTTTSTTHSVPGYVLNDTHGAGQNTIVAVDPDSVNSINVSYVYGLFNPYGGSMDTGGFVNLTHLICGYFSSSITTLDVSNNINLTYLDCASNQLTTLDVSNNINLTYLGCSQNQLTTLDVSNNINLTYLDCNRNQLTTINLPDPLPNYIYAWANNFTATALDNLLIDMASKSDKAGYKTFRMNDAARDPIRTSASDAAVTTLQSRGWTLLLRS